MTQYERLATIELAAWQRKMLSKPGLFNRFSKKVQTKINDLIPEKVHSTITAAIKQMVKVVLTGAEFTSSTAVTDKTLQEREELVRSRIDLYRNTAAVEGGVTGAGGILLGLADFPILFGIKIKLLFEIAGLYGFDVRDFRERLFLLHIFELSFSSDAHRAAIYSKIHGWNEKLPTLPTSFGNFDWRTFQQEYRDYIDLAKLAQLVPVIGAPVGVVVNYRLLKKLGEMAMNAYRSRILDASDL